MANTNIAAKNILERGFGNLDCVIVTSRRSISDNERVIKFKKQLFLVRRFACVDDLPSLLTQTSFGRLSPGSLSRLA
jgi:hypothetical protein